MTNDIIKGAGLALMKALKRSRFLKWNSQRLRIEESADIIANNWLNQNVVSVRQSMANLTWCLVDISCKQPISCFLRIRTSQVKFPKIRHVKNSHSIPAGDTLVPNLKWNTNTLFNHTAWELQLVTQIRTIICSPRHDVEESQRCTHCRAARCICKQCFWAHRRHRSNHNPKPKIKEEMNTDLSGYFCYNKCCYFCPAYVTACLFVCALALLCFLQVQNRLD